MYDRAGMQPLPFPFYQIPAPGERLSTLDFLPAMSTLLENMQGLAATSHAGSLGNELAYQELTQALFVLKEYTEAVLMLYERCHKDRYPGPTIDESDEGPDETKHWRPQDAG